jgi:hypothetical protein
VIAGPDWVNGARCCGLGVAVQAPYASAQQDLQESRCQPLTRTRSRFTSSPPTRCGGIPWALNDVRLEGLFDPWVFAARDADLALGAWASSQPGERAEAHAVHRAALDREERAAAVLASAAGERQPRAMTPAVPRRTYTSWAWQQVAHGKLSDLPLFGKEIKEAAYWAARDVITR